VSHHPRPTDSGAPTADARTAAGKNHRADAWLAPFLKPLRPLFQEIAAVSLFVNLLALASPVFVLQVYDRVVYHAGISTLQGLVVGMILVLAFDFILRQTRSRVMQTVSLNLDVGVGRRLFDKVMALPLRTLESRPAGYWQQTFRDLDTVRNTLSGAAAMLVFDIPFVVFFLILVYIIAQPIFFVLLIAVALFALLAWRSARAVGGAARDEKQTQQGRDALMAETIMGRTTIKALALADHLRPLWEGRQAQTIADSLERGSQTDRFVNLGHVLTLATTVGMTTIGAIAIINQDMTIGGLVAANMLSGRLMAPLNQLVGAWRTYAGFRQAVERLGGLFALAEDRSRPAIAQPRPTGRLKIEGVTFRYRPDGRPAIDDVTLEIRPGAVTAVMGRNGCGKSTLLKMLLGLYPPAAGRVLLDDADIGQFTRRELADWMGYVPQESVLFSGSIRDNIAQGRPGASDAEILAAAEAAGVHSFVVDLPDGYASDVGESGAILSGGMRQRIAIARALVGDPPVLLLDEPSGSLDRQAEEQLRTTLQDLARERTVMVVTHSPVLLAGCAFLVVMEAGHIALAGPTAEVMRRLQAAPAAATAPAAPAPAPASATGRREPVAAARQEP
jgi:PrtD family type I secretion system ABC transporter